MWRLSLCHIVSQQFLEYYFKILIPTTNVEKRKQGWFDDYALIFIKIWIFSNFTIQRQRKNLEPTARHFYEIFEISQELFVLTIASINRCWNQLIKSKYYYRAEFCPPNTIYTKKISLSLRDLFAGGEIASY